MRRSLAFAAAIAAVVPQLALAGLPDTKPASIAPLHRVDPEFPRSATRSGADSGLVTARMTLDSDGRVTSVEIVKAEPRRVFDAAVQDALAQWRYPEGRAGRLVEVEVAFHH